MATKSSSGLPSEERRAMCLATRDAAVAFIEDMDHFRQILNQPEISKGDLRRVTAALRRLLVERDITALAAPRIGRIIFRAPDNRPVHLFSRRATLTFFGSAGVEIFGLQLRGLAVYDSGSPPLNFEPETTMDLRLDNFLSQSVICLRGEWVSRSDVIKHVANIASGVHSGTAKEPTDKTIAAVRNFAKYSMLGTTPTISIDFDAGVKDNELFTYKAADIDPVW
jgi:hypothetical protein